jgi:tRNA-dihydrouridine synthase A
MLDWTDWRCRGFHRLLTRRARLYTEMVTTGALLFGDAQRHLQFQDPEHPVALQLGGSDPQQLARCAQLGAAQGYDEINLNCGCPSSRVQRGAFGACLMAQPQLVRECVRAMVEAVSLPVTVKHRIGLDREESYGFVRDFVGTVAEGGARVFIVHARNAWLEGLSPKLNREVPPLRYEFAYHLKRDFPDLTIVLNGGIRTLAQAHDHLQHLDGVMLGRQAYQDPWLLAEVDRQLFGEASPLADRAQAVAALVDWAARSGAGPAGWPLKLLTRHVLGLFNGQPGARRWRQMLSDPAWLERADASLLHEAARQSLGSTRALAPADEPLGGSRDEKLHDEEPQDGEPHDGEPHPEEPHRSGPQRLVGHA